jgi:hypothetical protein
LLVVDPDANWTACYNRLLELGPASIAYVASRPVMQRPAAPDDLRVMLHCSLLRLLSNPVDAPQLSVTCFETTLDVLHFEPKVRGRRLGEIRMPDKHPPRAWHDLYPTELNHALAAEIDVEADRRAVRAWWQGRRGQPAPVTARRPLRPRTADLRAVLARRYADVWAYELKPEVYLCGWPPTGAALLRGRTYDYNLVRAACIWLAAADEPGVLDELIELIAHPSPIVAYNARFALGHSPDPRIREVLERYNQGPVPTSTAAWYHNADDAAPRMDGEVAVSPPSSSCEGQRSATHEVDQVHHRLCLHHRHRHVHRRAVWWR